MRNSFAGRAVKFYRNTAKGIRIRVMTQILRLRITLFRFSLQRANKSQRASKEASQIIFV
jgi:hypothetical protein